jgi:ABC-type uncharacterized transport system ATPase subunit
MAPWFIDNSLVSRPLARDGIDTVVGENGVQLLVLDEATSTLDAQTEGIITETLDSLAGDVTLSVIAHRLATVRHCDQVIHLSGGGSLGGGLLRKCGRRCRSSIGRRSCWGSRGGWPALRAAHP